MTKHKNLFIFTPMLVLLASCTSVPQSVTDKARADCAKVFTGWERAKCVTSRQREWELDQKAGRPEEQSAATKAGPVAPITSGLVYEAPSRPNPTDSVVPTRPPENVTLERSVRADKKVESSRDGLGGSTQSGNLQTPCGAGYLNIQVCKGSIQLQGGGVYIGEIVLGKSDGYGTTTWPNGQKHVGFYKYDRPWGKGTHTWPDGQKFVGEFKDHGWKKGTLTTKDGVQYVGEFRGDGKQTGQGSVISPDGYKYVGEFRNGRRDGHGTSTWPDGTRYVGEHRDGKPHGQGTGTFPNGDKYVGEHLNGERHGQGTLTNRSGDTFTGAFKRDMKHGRGTVTYADGRPSLQGTWAEDKFSPQISSAPIASGDGKDLKVQSQIAPQALNVTESGGRSVNRFFPHSGDSYEFSITLDESWVVKHWSLEDQQKDNLLLGIAFGMGGDLGVLPFLEADNILTTVASSGSGSGDKSLRIQVLGQAINLRSTLMAGGELTELAGLSSRDRQRELNKLTVINELLLKGDTDGLRKAFDEKGECRWSQLSGGFHVCKTQVPKSSQSVLGASVSTLYGISLGVPLPDGVLILGCSLVEMRLPMNPAVGHKARLDATQKARTQCEQVLKSFQLRMKQ